MIDGFCTIESSVYLLLLRRCIIFHHGISSLLFHNRKSDYKRSESTLRKLLQLSPGHIAGTLQLARLLSDVYLDRSKQKAVTTTATQYEAITLEVCFLYEKYMELTEDVSIMCGLLIIMKVDIDLWLIYHITSFQPSTVVAEYINLIERLATKQQKVAYCYICQ